MSKKVLILMVAVAVLIFIVIALSSLFVKRPDNTKSESVSTTISTRPTLAQDINYYRGNGFSFQYPMDWKEQNRSNEVGTIILLQPMNNPEGVKATVQIKDAKKFPVSDLVSGYSSVNYKKETSTIGDVSVQKFTGSIASSKSRLNNVTYAFEYKEKLYVIKLSYTSDRPDPDLENTFQKIVESFSLY